MARLTLYKNVFENESQEIEVLAGSVIQDVINQNTDSTTYNSAMVECYDPELDKTFYAPIEDGDDQCACVTVNNKEVSADYVIQENDIVKVVYLPLSNESQQWQWLGAGIGNVAGTILGGLAGLAVGFLGGPIGWVAGLVGGAIIGNVMGTLAGWGVGYLAQQARARNTETKDYNLGKEGAKLPDVRGAENQPLTGNNFPYVIGKHLVSPFIIGNPYTTYEGNNGEDAIIREILAVGYAPLKLTDFKLGDFNLAYNRTQGTERNTVLHGLLAGVSGSETYTEDITTINQISEINSTAISYSGSIKANSVTYDFTSVQVQMTNNMRFFMWFYKENSLIYKLGCYAPLGNIVAYLDFDTLSTEVTVSEFKITYKTKEDTGTEEVDGGDILDYWADNDIQLEILQQHPDRDIDLGDIYPNKVVDTEINANLLFIADDDIEEVSKSKRINYKGKSFINGFRTNRVQLTESCPLEFTINLDMPNGLYGTYSDKDGNTKYESLPLWYAIQWRPYDSSNNSSNPDGQDYNLWNNFLLNGSDDFATYSSNFRGELKTYTTDCLNTDLNAHKGNSLSQYTSDGWSPTEVDLTQSIIFDSNLDSKELKFTFDSSGNMYFILSASGKKWNAGNFKNLSDYQNPVCMKEGDKVINCSYVKNNTTKLTYLALTGIGNDSEASYKVENLSDVIITYVNKNFTLTDVNDPTKTYVRHIDYIVSDFKIYKKDEAVYHSVGKYWFDKDLYNFQNYSGEDGISEMRASFTCKLNKDFIKEKILSSSNNIKGVEIRVVRVSPCYLNMTSKDGDNSAHQYTDNIVWLSCTTKVFDEDKLSDYDELKPVPVLSDADARKLCLIAIKAKADVTGQIEQQMKKINCVAESFSPYLSQDETTKKYKFLPENIHSVYKYYEPVKNTTTGNNEWKELVDTTRTVDGVSETYSAKSQYEDKRHQGIDCLAVKEGTNYGDVMKRLVLSNYDETNNRYVLKKEHYVYNETNAASGTLLSIVGPQNGPAALGYEKLDLLSFIDWYNFNTSVSDGSTYKSDTNGHKKGERLYVKMEANAYIYKGQKFEDLIKKLTICGRAVYTHDENSRLKIIVDKKVKYPVGTINQQNCVNASDTYTWGELPAGLQFNFSDENDGYEQNVIYCWNDNNSLENYKGQVESYNIDYVTNPYQLWSLGRWVLAQRVLQRCILTRKISKEGKLYSIGDVVSVQDDNLLIGLGSAKIQQTLILNGLLYGFVTDAPFTYTNETEEIDDVTVSKLGVSVIQPTKFGDSRVVTRRLATPNSYVVIGGETYKMTVGVTNVVLFNDPVEFDLSNKTTSDNILYSFKTGYTCMFGYIDKIYELYRIIKIKPEKGGSFTEILIPYFDELYEYGDKIPSFQPKITMPPAQNDAFTLSDTATTIKDLQANISNIATTVTQGIAESLDVNQYILDVSPEYQAIPFSKEGETIVESFNISAFMYYKDSLIESDIIYKAILDNGTEIGTWEDNKLTVPTSLITEDTLNITIVATYDIDNEPVVKTLTAVVARLYSGEDMSLYKMQFPDGEKIKVDNRGDFNPSALRVLRKEVNKDGEKDTGYGYITVDGGIEGEQAYEPYKKVEESESYTSKVSYYKKVTPTLIKFNNNLVLGLNDVASLFYIKE